MTYDQLSAEQKAALNAFMVAYRPTMGQVSRMLKQMANIVDAADAGVAAILGSLTDGSTIADPNGLAGSLPLTVEHIEADIAGMRQILAGYDTSAKRQERIKAAGLANT